MKLTNHFKLPVCLKLFITGSWSLLAFNKFHLHSQSNIAHVLMNCPNVISIFVAKQTIFQIQTSSQGHPINKVCHSKISVLDIQWYTWVWRMANYVPFLIQMNDKKVKKNRKLCTDHQTRHANGIKCHYTFATSLCPINNTCLSIPIWSLVLILILYTPL